MESSGTTPRVGLDCSDLQGVLDPNGHFLTVYLTTEPGEHAGQHTALRWKALAHDAESHAAAPEAIKAVVPLLREAHKGGRCLCVVVDGTGTIRHRSHHPEPPRRDVARWGTLPSLAPMIEWRQASPPHVVVLVDRVGADIVVFESLDAGDFHVEVEGDDEVIRKVGAGGWSQRRYQQRAENTWEANAKEVAAQLAKIVEQVHARLVVVAGDVRAVQLLRESLPHSVQQILHEVEGGRSPDGSVDAVAGEAVTLVATAVASDTADLLAKFREELGQHDRAANGPEAVATALEGGQVETLLIHDDPADERICWIGPEPFHVALEASTLKDMGVDDPLGSSPGGRVLEGCGRHLGPRAHSSVCVGPRWCGGRHPPVERQREGELAMAITGIHTLLYSSEPEKLREVLRDVFGWNHVDAGGGWLIFALPPAEMGIHPAMEEGGAGTHELTFLCDDLDTTLADLESKGVSRAEEPADERFGRVCRVHLPGGVKVMIYEPSHPTAI